MAGVWLLVHGILVATAVFEKGVCAESPNLQGYPGPRGPAGPIGPPGFPGVPGMRGPQGGTTKCPCDTKSAFTVKFSGKLPPPAEPVTYTEALYNGQGDLKEETGVFTCRLPGNYHFQFDAELQHCNMTVWLKKNQTAVLEKHQVATEEYRNLAGTLILPLGIGEKVWLETQVKPEDPDQARATIYFSAFLM